MIKASNGDHGTPFQVECTNEALSFAYEQITAITCTEVEKFTEQEIPVDGNTMQYYLREVLPDRNYPGAE